MSPEQEIRLEITRTLLECGSRVALMDPAGIIKTASRLEKYVVGDKPKRGRPPKPREEANSATPTS